jgi:hypothetical protein
VTRQLDLAHSTQCAKWLKSIDERMVQLRTECLYGLYRSQADRMDNQNSARAKEREAESAGQGLRKQALAAGNYRVEGWPKQGASQEPRITRISSRKAWLRIERFNLDRVESFANSQTHRVRVAGCLLALPIRRQDSPGIVARTRFVSIAARLFSNEQFYSIPCIARISESSTVSLF